MHSLLLFHGKTVVGVDGLISMFLYSFIGRLVFYTHIKLLKVRFIRFMDLRPSFAMKLKQPSIRKGGKPCIVAWMQSRPSITNKFVYTTEQSRVIGQEQLCPKIMKKVK